MLQKTRESRVSKLFDEWFDDSNPKVYVPKMQLRCLLRLWYARQLPHWSLQRLDPLKNMTLQSHVQHPCLLFVVLVYNSFPCFCGETLLIDNLNPTSSDAPYHGHTETCLCLFLWLVSWELWYPPICSHYFTFPFAALECTWWDESGSTKYRATLKTMSFS